MGLQILQNTTHLGKAEFKHDEWLNEKSCMSDNQPGADRTTRFSLNDIYIHGKRTWAARGIERNVFWLCPKSGDAKVNSVQRCQRPFTARWDTFSASSKKATQSPGDTRFQQTAATVPCEQKGSRHTYQPDLVTSEHWWVVWGISKAASSLNTVHLQFHNTVHQRLSSHIKLTESPSG